MEEVNRKDHRKNLVKPVIIKGFRKVFNVEYVFFFRRYQLTNQQTNRQRM